jgi:3-hydroxybutyrate dehydrogenase
MNPVTQVQPAVPARVLADKVAIVTGSTSGIGLGILQGLARAGCRVVMNGFGDATAIQHAQDLVLAETSAEVFYSDADMSRPEAIHQMVAQTLERWGRVDILVNNAGIQYTAPIESFPAEKWDAILAINLSSAFHTTQAVLPGMQARGWGRIINIASAHGLVASPQKAAYVAAKHGLVGLTKVTALENAQRGITANAVCPGFVETPLVQKQLDDLAATHHISREQARDDILLAKHPNKQFVQVSQLADLVVFLCTDAAASITGAALPMDGGWTAQ